MKRPDPKVYPAWYARGGFGFIQQAELEEFRDIVKGAIQARISWHQERVIRAKDFLNRSDSFYDSQKDVWCAEHDVQEQQQHLQLLDELIFLSLHRSLEVDICRLVNKYLPEVDLRKIYRWDIASKELPFLKGLFGAEHINEMRLISNSIKHSGRVSKELARRYPNWEAGQELKGLDVAYTRIAPYVGGYWIDFCNRLEDFSEPDGSAPSARAEERSNGRS